MKHTYNYVTMLSSKLGTFKMSVGYVKVLQCHDKPGISQQPLQLSNEVLNQILFQVSSELPEVQCSK